MVSVENPSGPGSILVPENAEGSIFDAQGQEYENATNFLNKSNPNQPPSKKYEAAQPRDINKLLRQLDTSAQQFLETQNRCRAGGCK
jgi:hypothetical protein